jgi:hypothetical protein
MNRTNAGFTNLLMAGMLVVLMAIGGIVTMVVRTSERVEQAQTRMNTDARAKKLAEYVIDNLATDNENNGNGDGILEVVPQYYTPLQQQPNSTQLTTGVSAGILAQAQSIGTSAGSIVGSNPTTGGAGQMIPTYVASGAQGPDTISGLGYLPANQIPEALQSDAAGNFFRICSVKLFDNSAPDTQWPQITADPYKNYFLLGTNANDSQRFINQPVFIIVSGKNGQAPVGANCDDYVSYALGNIPTPPGGDFVHVVKYGELVAAQLKKRLALVKDVPECGKDSYLQLKWDNAQSQATWECADDLQKFVSQDLPKCNSGDRLILQGDGTLACRSVTELNNPAGAQQLVQMDVIAAPFCPYGYTPTRVEFVASTGPMAMLNDRKVTCTKLYPEAQLSNMPAGVASPATLIRQYKTTQGNCSNTILQSPAGSVRPVFYLARDGRMQCMTVKRILPADIVVDDLSDLYGIDHTIGMYYERGYLVDPNTIAVFGTKRALLCQNNGSPNYNAERGELNCGSSILAANFARPPESNYACADGNYIVLTQRSGEPMVTNCFTPQQYDQFYINLQASDDFYFYDFGVARQGQACDQGEYISYLNGRLKCMNPQNFLLSIMPVQSCTRTQMLGWDRSDNKFICVER